MDTDRTKVRYDAPSSVHDIRPEYRKGELDDVADRGVQASIGVADAAMFEFVGIV